MSSNARVHQCQCAACGSGEDHEDREFHHQVNVLMSRFDELEKRWFVAVESNRMGHGGDTRISEITGISVVTIRRGRMELANDLEDRPAKVSDRQMRELDVRPHETCPNWNYSIYPQT